MKRKHLLRLISLCMLLVAMGFVLYALGHPEAGGGLSLFGVPLGAEAYWMLYALYLTLMVGLFVASFFCDRRST